MRKITKGLICIVCIMIVGGSVWLGGYLKEQEHIRSRAQRCKTQISFAIEKVKNHDLSEEGVRNAMISNIYAAREFCDAPEVSAELSDLWNTLLFRREEYDGKEDALVERLRRISEQILLEE